MKITKFVDSMITMKGKKTVKAAILDLYEGHANQGMRCIREIIDQYNKSGIVHIVYDEFDVRLKNEVPDITYDLYISSGGPGSPLETENCEWEKKYFNWLHTIESWNANPTNTIKKHVFFICHSFQLACRHYKVGNVTKRKSTAFGVFPVHLMEEGKDEIIFSGLNDPFYAVDSRDYQVIQPNHFRIHQMGATLLCIEKERPHVPLERAIMAMRFNEYMIGTQFHPEADAVGMTTWLVSEEKKKVVIENHGEEKWKSMLEHLSDPDKILWTYSHVLPNFLQVATKHLQLTEAMA
ncbi:MAG TPA: GMP synthase [Chitinophagaceae bacterium]|nr:GMP synthase [Chitinophagaceae bacterium]